MLFRLILLAGLALNALVPAGFMVAPSARGIPVIMLCPGAHPVMKRVSTGRDHHAASHQDEHRHVHSKQHDGTDPRDPAHDGERHDAGSAGDCPFASFTNTAAGTTDPGALATALDPARHLKLGPVRQPVLHDIARLRPPLRAPPLTA